MIASEEAQIIARMPAIIKRLSPYRRALLKEIFFLLNLIQRKSEYNLMNADNLSTIFGMSLCLPRVTLAGGMINILSSVMNSFNKCKLCKILVSDYVEIFADIDTLPLGKYLIFFGGLTASRKKEHKRYSDFSW